MSENTLTLKYPTSEKINVIFKFISDALEEDVLEVEKVIIDFQSRNFCKPPHLVALACLIEKIKVDNPNIEIAFDGGGPKLNDHLKNIKFKKYWNPGFARNEYTSAENNTTFCLWQISQNMIETYGEQAKVYFKRNFLNDKDLQPLSTNLKEIFNNIFDHSKSEVQGYVLTQFYPNKKRLSFCVCDFGVGIPYLVNKYLKQQGEQTLSDSDAILKSLEYMFTVHSTERNRGMGLNSVKEFSDSSGGKLLIISNQGVILKEHDKDYQTRSIPEFKGTLISVEIDSRQFDEYDIEEEIYEL